MPAWSGCARLAHELGHYAGGHTRFGALTYRGMRSIADTVGRVGPRSVAGALLTSYAMVYALVALAVMRRMEVEADRAGVGAAGRGEMVLALGDLARLGTAWEA
jgi:Zn-dependent protease with chaperone function